MTVQRDLERAIAMAEAARGNYLLFASDSEDEKAQQVFTDMAEDMKRHVMILESRQEYLEKHNALNARDDQEGGKKEAKKGEGKES